MILPYRQSGVVGISKSIHQSVEQLKDRCKLTAPFDLIRN